MRRCPVPPLRFLREHADDGVRGLVGGLYDVTHVPPHVGEHVAGGDEADLAERFLLLDEVVVAGLLDAYQRPEDLGGRGVGVVLTLQRVLGCRRRRRLPRLEQPAVPGGGLVELYALFFRSAPREPIRLVISSGYDV